MQVMASRTPRGATVKINDYTWRRCGRWGRALFLCTDKTGYLATIILYSDRI